MIEHKEIVLKTLIKTGSYDQVLIIFLIIGITSDLQTCNSRVQCEIYQKRQFYRNLQRFYLISKNCFHETNLITWNFPHFLIYFNKNVYHLHSQLVPLKKLHIIILFIKHSYQIYSTVHSGIDISTFLVNMKL